MKNICAAREPYTQAKRPAVQLPHEALWDFQNGIEPKRIPGTDLVEAVCEHCGSRFVEEGDFGQKEKKS